MEELSMDEKEEEEKEEEEEEEDETKKVVRLHKHVVNTLTYSSTSSLKINPLS